jgi:hypothetical protein
VLRGCQLKKHQRKKLAAPESLMCGRRSLRFTAIATLLAINLLRGLRRVPARISHPIFGAIVIGVLVDFRVRRHGRSQSSQTHKSKSKRKGLHFSTPCLIVATTIVGSSLRAGRTHAYRVRLQTGTAGVGQNTRIHTDSSVVCMRRRKRTSLVKA